METIVICRYDVNYQKGKGRLCLVIKIEPDLYIQLSRRLNGFASSTVLHLLQSCKHCIHSYKTVSTFVKFPHYILIAS